MKDWIYIGKPEYLSRCIGRGTCCASENCPGYVHGDCCFSGESYIVNHKELFARINYEV